jgi:hypothetical protein
MQQFYDRWIPLENAYFEAYRLPGDGVVVINGRYDALIRFG